MFVKKLFLFIVFCLLICDNLVSQESVCKSFKKLSCPEKSWVVFHPFVAKKALNISLESRKVTVIIKQQQLLKGEGNGDQLDAFRHTYWMALLSLEIGAKKAKKLGVAHEKGNYRQFKKGKTEDGALPDKIASEMDLQNNDLGIALAKTESPEKLKELVAEKIKSGEAKIVKKDQSGNFLDANGQIIPIEELKGKWENRKVLVNSDF